MAFERTARVARHTIGLLAFTASTLPSLAAHADPTAADRESARGLMLQGDKKFAGKDYAGALKAYQAAHATMSVPSTGAALARAQVASGLLVEARDTAISVTRLPAKPHEPAPFVKARAEAAKLVDSLEARIPTVQISVEGPSSGSTVDLSIDDQSLPPESLELGRKTNPGKHTLHAASRGFADATAEVTLAEGETVTVKLSLVRIPEKPSLRPPVSTSVATFDKASAPQKSHRSPLVFIGFGLGAAGVATGAVAGVLELTRVSNVKKTYCNGGTECQSGFETPTKNAKMLATVATVGFSAGAVGIGLGIIGLATSKSSTTGANDFYWSPVVGVGSVGVSGGF
jgi:hypothetical protein